MVALQPVQLGQGKVVVVLCMPLSALGLGLVLCMATPFVSQYCSSFAVLEDQVCVPPALLYDVMRCDVSSVYNTLQLD